MGSCKELLGGRHAVVVQRLAACVYQWTGQCGSGVATRGASAYPL